MAATNKRVNNDNVDDVYWYFKKAFGRHDYSALIDPTRCGEAIHEFENVAQYPFCLLSMHHSRHADGDYSEHNDVFNKRCDEELNMWVSANVSPQGWKRCLSNIRQSKYAQANKGKLKPVKISVAGKAALAKAAKGNKLSQDDCLQLMCARDNQIRSLSRSLKMTPEATFERMLELLREEGSDSNICGSGM